MLIEFKAANYRSICEEQILSLVASRADKDLPGCVIDHPLPGLSGIQCLKGAALYGANASGKSNILNAIQFMAHYVRWSATRIKPGDSTGAEPFKLDKDSAAQPSRFEITFLAEGIRYLFGLSITPERVTEEYLIAYPKGSPQRWYHRVFDPGANKYKWAKPSSAFKHDKDLQNKTRDNSLFLSVGPQFNHKQLTPIYNWFKNNLRFLDLGADRNVPPSFSAQMFNEPNLHNSLLNLIRYADIGIVDGKIKEKEISLDDMRQHIPPVLLNDIERSATHSGKIVGYEINLLHKAEGMKPIALDFESEESAGTQRFFALAGPWVDILANGHTVIVDEIETSLHSLLVKELLKLFFSSETNPKGAQVIFTTHNPILLDQTLMRRDQIWFTEKVPSGATRLYPLTDYQPRKDEALAKGYLAGRYGAIPYLPEGLKL